MAAIYDKALKRQDYSGIINKDKQEEAMPSGDEHNTDLKSTPFPVPYDEILMLFPDKKKDKKKIEQEKEAKSDDPKAGADVGKIVNLMAGDANRVCLLILTSPND